MRHCAVTGFVKFHERNSGPGTSLSITTKRSFASNSPSTLLSADFIVATPALALSHEPVQKSLIENFVVNDGKFCRSHDVVNGRRKSPAGRSLTQKAISMATNIRKLVGI
jgi:hypothetical protein